MQTQIESKFAKLLAIGLFLITTIVVAGPVSDPVNVPKMLLLGMVAFGSLPLLIYRKDSFRNGSVRIPLVTTVFFIIALFVTALTSHASFTQNIYGNLGRNTGLITFVSFSIIFLVCSTISSEKNFLMILNSFYAAGFLDVAYGLIQKFFGDPIPWNNNYGVLLGTFGNPDFAGSFYGLFSAAVFAKILDNKLSNKTRSLWLIILIASFYCVFLTDTSQGILVTLVSMSVIAFFFIRGKWGKKLANFYLFGLFLAFILTLLGMLQKGPLQDYLYKRSVSLRGVYWKAAFDVGKSHFFTGVGLDSFGDWYRRARSLKGATWLPGPETTTNTSHNYFLDIFASGGIILLISYLCFILLGIICCVMIYKRNVKYDSVESTLIAVFVGFEAQSLISIPQIGLAVWGWVFVGLLFAYSHNLNFEKLSSVPRRFSKVTKNIKDSSAGVLAFIGLILGFIIALPPFSADLKWTNALKSHNLHQLEISLMPGYFNPLNIDRLLSAVLLLRDNKLPNQEYFYAKKGVGLNPDKFEAWRILYTSQLATELDKKEAIYQMKRLDPLNTNLDKLK